ncbi:MAG: VOC family protein [Pseudomonadota bacterium]
MPTIKTNGEITISFNVKDRAVSAAWFKTHFGFEEMFSMEDEGWTEISTDTPGVTLGFGDATEVQHGNCVPVFGVADIAKARSDLEAAETRFDGDTIHIDGMVKLATFYDPDGNAFMLAESLTK